jgi:hypothetical protein
MHDKSSDPTIIPTAPSPAHQQTDSSEAQTPIARPDTTEITNSQSDFRDNTADDEPETLDAKTTKIQDRHASHSYKEYNLHEYRIGDICTVTLATSDILCRYYFQDKN